MESSRRSSGEIREALSGEAASQGQPQAAWIEAIVDLARRHKVRMLLDSPCGDAAWVTSLAAHVDLYAGFHVDPTLLRERVLLEHDFGGRVQFHFADPTVDQLPKADLVVCRNGLERLTEEQALLALARIAASRGRWLLASTYPNVTVNAPGELGGWRPLNLVRAPFSLPEPVELIEGGPNGGCLGLWDLHAVSAVLPRPSPPPSVIMLRPPGATIDPALNEPHVPTFSEPPAAEAAGARASGTYPEPEAEPDLELIVRPGLWTASSVIPLAAAPDLLVEFEVLGGPGVEVEIQLIRERAGGGSGKLAWYSVHRGQLAREHRAVALSSFFEVEGFTPGPEDGVYLRAKGLGADPCRVRLSRFRVRPRQAAGVDAPTKRDRKRKMSAGARAAVQVALSGAHQALGPTPAATLSNQAMAAEARARLLSEWGNTKTTLSQRCFFLDEPIAFDFEVVRLAGPPFTASAVAKASLSIQGWSSRAKVSIKAEWVSTDVVRGRATAEDLVVGEALRNAHGPGEHHRSQTCDLVLTMGGALISCGQILTASMPRPERLVLNLGSKDDLSPGLIGLDVRPFRKDGVESVMWDFGSGLSFAADGELDGVTVSHALMYTDLQTAKRFMRDTFRALKSEAVLRVTEDDARVHFADECTYARLVTDPSVLCALLREAGFEPELVDPHTTYSAFPEVMRRLHMTSWNELAGADSASRIFFVEGVKPLHHYAVATTRIRDPLKGLAAENIIDHNQFALLPNASFLRLGGVRSSFTADPFLFRKDGRFYLFFEARANPACIGVAESADGLVWEKPRVCLKPATHRSFPFVFEWEGEVYMIPESAADENVALLKAVQFPDTWERVRTLVEGKPFADGSIITVDGVHYLFVWAQTKLLIYFSTNLLEGEFRPHPCNPAAQGPRLGRPGGKPFRAGGELYRPAQDCERYYGERVHLMKILELTPDRYAEEVFEENFIEGDLAHGALSWKAKIHHYDVLELGPDEWLCAFDGTGILANSIR